MAARQPINDLLGDAVTEVCLPRIIANIAERQHSQRRPSHPGELRLRLGWDRCHSRRRANLKNTDCPTYVLQLLITEITQRDWHQLARVFVVRRVPTQLLQLHSEIRQGRHPPGSMSCPSSTMTSSTLMPMRTLRGLAR